MNDVPFIDTPWGILYQVIDSAGTYYIVTERDDVLFQIDNNCFRLINPDGDTAVYHRNNDTEVWLITYRGSTDPCMDTWCMALDFVVEVMKAPNVTEWAYSELLSEYRRKLNNDNPSLGVG